MKRKGIVLGSVLLAIVLMLGITSLFGAEEKAAEDYVSTVTSEDCKLCGAENIYRGTEALGFVLVDQTRWDFDNIGMIQYCQQDPLADNGCYYERIKDEGLTEEERLHKHEPFDINGLLKQEMDMPFQYTRSFSSLKRGGIGGTIQVLGENGLIACTFDTSGHKGVDGDYLCSVLCQDCFGNIYPLTRDTNFFFVDCKSGEAFSPHTAEESSFEVRDYTFNIQLRDSSNLIFYATYDASPGENTG